MKQYTREDITFLLMRLERTYESVLQWDASFEREFDEVAENYINVLRATVRAVREVADVSEIEAVNLIVLDLLYSEEKRQHFFENTAKHLAPTDFDAIFDRLFASV